MKVDELGFPTGLLKLLQEASVTLPELPGNTRERLYILLSDNLQVYVPFSLTQKFDFYHEEFERFLLTSGFDFNVDYSVAQLRSLVSNFFKKLLLLEARVSQPTLTDTKELEERVKANLAQTSKDFVEEAAILIHTFEDITSLKTYVNSLTAEFLTRLASSLNTDVHLTFLEVLTVTQQIPLFFQYLEQILKNTMDKSFYISSELQKGDYSKIVPNILSDSTSKKFKDYSYSLINNLELRAKFNKTGQEWADFIEKELFFISYSYIDNAIRRECLVSSILQYVQSYDFVDQGEHMVSDLSVMCKKFKNTLSRRIFDFFEEFQVDYKNSSPTIREFYSKYVLPKIQRTQKK